MPDSPSIPIYPVNFGFMALFAGVFIAAHAWLLSKAASGKWLVQLS
jgi:hypothetical protein